MEPSFERSRPEETLHNHRGRLCPDFVNTRHSPDHVRDPPQELSETKACREHQECQEAKVRPKEQLHEQGLAIQDQASQCPTSCKEPT